MFVLNILCHDLVGYESSRGLGTKLAECRYETSKPGYESSGYERSMGTKRLDTAPVQMSRLTASLGQASHGSSRRPRVRIPLKP